MSGGVSKIIGFNNLSGAVMKMLAGTKHSLTEMFLIFQ